jgi:hypothetical protein
MNKSKKELYEENKKLKNVLKSYSKFWETDAIEELIKQQKNTKIILYVVSVVLLMGSAFLIGLGW